jgi:hypothetical protein
MEWLSFTDLKLKEWLKKDISGKSAQKQFAIWLIGAASVNREYCEYCEAI